MKVIVLIADIIKSKDIEERKAFQKKLVTRLENINSSSKTILSPYTVTLGDEFQAVYRSGEEILDHIFFLLVHLYPTGFRFSLCYDELSTEINTVQAIGMDGPAFYKARRGMDAIKKINHSVIRIIGFNPIHTDLVNSGCDLAMAVMNNWDKKTLSIFYDLFKGRQVKEIIPDYDLSRRGMYKLIERNKLREFLEFFRCVQKEMKKEIEAYSAA